MKLYCPASCQSGGLLEQGTMYVYFPASSPPVLPLQYHKTDCRRGGPSPHHKDVYTFIMSYPFIFTCHPQKKMYLPPTRHSSHSSRTTHLNTPDLTGDFPHWLPKGNCPPLQPLSLPPLFTETWLFIGLTSSPDRYRGWTSPVFLSCILQNTNLS